MSVKKANERKVKAVKSDSNAEIDADDDVMD